MQKGCLMPKFDPNISYFKTHTAEMCGICHEGLSHPPIMLPAGPAYVDPQVKSVQSQSPLLKYPQIKCCHRCAIVLLAPDLEHDTNHPNEGKWWREWMEGKFEPIGLSDAAKPTTQRENDNDQSGNDGQTG